MPFSVKGRTVRQGPKLCVAIPVEDERRSEEKVKVCVFRDDPEFGFVKDFFD
jgi:hypothetical protein